MTVEKNDATSASLLHYVIEPFSIYSKFLEREVILDAYVPKDITNPAEVTLLLINDGQDMDVLGLAPMLDRMTDANEIQRILAVGIHCNHDRRLEYGTADILDYNQRGSKAKFHRQFVMEELLPFLRQKYLPQVKDIAFAGFSLGGLSALDISWKYPDVFKTVGVFSGSLWWRLKDLNDGYVEDTDRIMHKLIREGNYAPAMKFFFSTGTQDETMDRNNNGIIDSIDDTLGLIDELIRKGYNRDWSINYLELQEGRHDVPTWGIAMPYFLKWGWGK